MNLNGSSGFQDLLEAGSRKLPQALLLAFLAAGREGRHAHGGAPWILPPEAADSWMGWP